jgi:transposase-like protein
MDQTTGPYTHSPESESSKERGRSAMRKPRYSETEIIQILDRSKSWSVEETTAKFGISRATLYRWRARYQSRALTREVWSSDIHARLARLEEQTGKLRALCNTLLNRNSVKML